MLKQFLATTSIALLAAMPAVAGGLADPVVDPAPTYQFAEPSADWTGFYAGAHVTAGVEAGVSFWGLGAHAGYLYDMGEFVLGGEANYSYLPGPGVHFGGVDAIFGYDAGDVMPHLTLGGIYASGAGGVFGVTAGAGLSVKLTEDVLLTGRYRYSYYPTVPSSIHQGILAVSYRF